MNTELLITPGPLNPNMRAYSGSMTHQIGAVQSAASEDTSHLSTPQLTSRKAGRSVTRVPSSAVQGAAASLRVGLCRHLVERESIDVFSLGGEVHVAAAVIIKTKNDKVNVAY